MLGVSVRCSASIRHNVCFLFLLLLPVVAIFSASAFRAESRVRSNKKQEAFKGTAPANSAAMLNSRIDQPRDLSASSVKPTSQLVSQNSVTGQEVFSLHSISNELNSWLPWLVGAWLTGVGYMSIRFAVAWFQIDKIRRTATPNLAHLAARRRFRLARRRWS